MAFVKPKMKFNMALTCKKGQPTGSASLGLQEPANILLKSILRPVKSDEQIDHTAVALHPIGLVIGL